MTQRDTPRGGTQPPARHNILPALLDQAVPITDLDPHPQNARRRDAQAEHELRQSLEVNGQYRAVVTRRLDGRLQLLAGHGTVEQARQLGWTHVAAEAHEDLDDEAALRIVAVDNRTSDLAGYDDTQLLQLLQSLPNLAGSGYDDAAMAALLEAAGDEPAARTDPDDAPAPPAAADVVSRPGDVWLLGPHRLVVGDGADPDVVARALDSHDADAYITDPPYNVDYTGGTAEALTIANDAMSPEEFHTLLTGLFAAAVGHTKPGGPAYVFHADSAGQEFRQTFAGTGWLLKQILIWAKDHLVLGRQDHHWQHEPILYGWRPGAAHAWYGGRTLTTLIDDQPVLADMTKPQLQQLLGALFEESTVLRYDRPRRSGIHPTMKPVDLLTRLLERSSRPGDRILDTCAGSGSVLIACHHTRRRAALVELDPKYADVICRRYQEHTGVAPVHAGTGDTRDFVGQEAA